MHPLNFFKRLRNWIGYSIRRRLILWSTTFWIISITIISLTVGWVGQARAVQETSRRNTQLASIISRDISSQISRIAADIRTFASHLKELDPGLTTQAGAILSLRIASPELYKGAYYFDEQNNLLFELNDTRENLLLIKDPADIVSRETVPVEDGVLSVYNRASDSFYISDVNFVDIERVPVLYIGMPLNFNTSLKSVLIFEIDLGNIWQSVNLVSIGQSGFAYIVSRNGIIVAHHDPAYVGRQMTIQLNPLLSGYEGSVEYLEPYQNKTVLAAYSPVGGQLGWGVVVEQDQSEAYASINGTNMISIGIWLALACVGTVGILLMGSRFSKPIVELTHKARRIAETGDLTPLQIAPSSDEVGQMGQAFATMVERIQESESMFRGIVENSHAGIFIIDNSFHLIYANNRLAEMLAGTREEIVGHSFQEFLDEESKVLVSERYTQRQRGESLPSRYEFGFIRKDGMRRMAELSSAVTKNAKGDIITIGQILDITERKMAEMEIIKAHDELEARVEQRTQDLSNANTLLQDEIIQRREIEEKLRSSELKYRDLVENANSIVLEMNPKGNIIYFNPFAQQFFGYKEEDILGRNVVGTIVPEFDANGKDMKKLIVDVTSNPEKYCNSENENMRHNGERVWIAWTNKGVYDSEGKLRHILCNGIDRTEQRLASEMLAEKARAEAAAGERTRLARDLHDAVSQTLFSASLIADVLPRLWERNKEEGLKRLEEVRQLTRGALAEMRTLLFELRPTALAEAELNELLRHLADSVTGRARVPVALEIEGECAVPTNVKIAFYRIAQEALNNVAKHSGASHAEINLYCQPRQITLNINDDGNGFDSTKIRPGSLGMTIMKERAESIGASLDINSIIDRGTEIIVTWQDFTKED